MIPDRFAFTLPPVRIRMGPGLRASVGEEVARLGRSRALVLTTPAQAALGREIVAALGQLSAGQFCEARMHTPLEVTERALIAVRAARADCLVAAGGGSTTGLGKAIALRTGLDQVVIPTTYAGSEATPVLGETEAGRKTTRSDPAIRPEVILYDPELVAGLPIPMTVVSGLNAMAHAVEALYARDRDPLSSLMAAEGLRHFAEGLPAVVARPDDLGARGRTLYAAWLCGMVLGQVGMALHHKLCHTLGGAFDLPHAETHAVILPHVAAFNAGAAGAALTPVTSALGGEDPGAALHAFALRLGAPTALRDLGLSETDLDRAADLAVANPYWNPRPVERAGVRALLQDAWAGAPPGTRVEGGGA
jgi:maleylacetate reductase